MKNVLLENGKKTDLYEFTVLNDLERTDREGKTYIYKKGVITHSSFYLADIAGIGEIYNQKGRVLKEECSIFHADLGRMVVKHKYKDLYNIINGSNRREKIGGYTQNRSEGRHRESGKESDTSYSRKNRRRKP